MLPGYMDGIIAAGGIPVMLPLTEDGESILQIVRSFDGFLFTGGQDVSPEFYGEGRLPECGECSPQRDAMEKVLLEAALDADKPIFGICRGIQFLNAALGGTLYQDLPTQYVSETEHHMVPPYDRIAHKVAILKDTPLSAMLSLETLGVNSYHHQAVKALSPRLKPMAVSEDGLTEAVYMPGWRFVMAVQWHPEFFFKKDRSSAIIFEKFVEAAKLEK